MSVTGSIRILTSRRVATLKWLRTVHITRVLTSVFLWKRFPKWPSTKLKHLLFPDNKLSLQMTYYSPPQPHAHHQQSIFLRLQFWGQLVSKANNSSSYVEQLRVLDWSVLSICTWQRGTWPTTFQPMVCLTVLVITQTQPFFRLTWVIRSWKSDVLREKANQKPIYRYFKCVTSIQNSQPVY